MWVSSISIYSVYIPNSFYTNCLAIILASATLPTNILLWLKQQLEQLDSLSLADAFHSILLLWRHLHTAGDSEYVVLLQELLPSLIQLLHQHTIGQLRTLNQQTTASVDVWWVVYSNVIWWLSIHTLQSLYSLASNMSGRVFWPLSCAPVAVHPGKWPSWDFYRLCTANA